MSDGNMIIKSQAEVLTELLEDQLWEMRPLSHQWWIMGRALKLGIDIYGLRAEAWGIDRREAITRISFNFTARKPMP